MSQVLLTQLNTWSITFVAGTLQACSGWLLESLGSKGLLNAQACLGDLTEVCNCSLA